MASIYAEFLANIQQVAIYVTLPSLPTWNTVVTLNGDKVTVTTKHYGSNTTALLPAKVQGPSELVLHDDQSLEHSWRLPVIPDGTRPSTAFPLDAVNDAPWSAFDMTSKASILCLVCLRQKKFQPLVERGKVKVWKDLPSQNWAELMEFWHCHKPSDVSSGKELRTSSKGYSAESSLLAEQGTGLINTTSFLLAEGDCTGLSVRIIPLLLVLRSLDSFLRYPYLPNFLVPLRQQEGDLSRYFSAHGLITDTIAEEKSLVKLGTLSEIILSLFSKRPRWIAHIWCFSTISHASAFHHERLKAHKIHVILARDRCKSQFFSRSKLPTVLHSSEHEYLP